MLQVAEPPARARRAALTRAALTTGLAAFATAALLLGACGSRSSLFAESAPDAPGLPRNDAATAAHGRTLPFDDGGADGENSVTSPPPPALEPIDAELPDTLARCPSTTTATPYLVAASGTLYTFDPPTAATRPTGAIACVASAGATPFTMAASTRGELYVLYSDGALFRVNLASRACERTPYVDGQLGFPSDVGLAIAPGERLLVYGCRHGAGSCAPFLAGADLSAFQLAPIGPITPDPGAGYPPEIKADAYGRLFACDAAGHVFLIDATTGRVLGEDATGLHVGAYLALLAYGSDIFLVTGAQGLIHRYDLASKQLTIVGSVGDAIVGAAAAPCVP